MASWQGAARRGLRRGRLRLNTGDGQKVVGPLTGSQQGLETQHQRGIHIKNPPYDGDS
jgi:hypothetical protein